MPKKGTRKAKASSSVGPNSSPFTSGYNYPPKSPRNPSSSYDSTPRRPMRSLSGSSVNPKSSSASFRKSLSSSPSSPSSSSSHLSPVLAPVKLAPFVKATTKKVGCKGKKIVECNTTPGCKFTTGSKRNFCRTIKNAAKLTLSPEEIEMLINQVSNAYAGEKRLKYVIGRIRKTKCKFAPKYVGTFTGRKFVGEGMVYNQAMDKIQTFFKDGAKTVF
jgi:hypothetical protein